MKKLLLLPVLTFAAWSAYWVIGKNTLMGAIAEAQTDLQQDGIELSTQTIKVKGYPLNYQASLSGVDIKSESSAKDVNAWQQAGAMTVPDFAMNWGKVSFHGEVDLQMSPPGANGAATLGVSDADALVQSFVEAGMISQNQALGATFLLMAAPQDAQGRTVLTFPVQNSALTLFGQKLHQF